MKPTDEAVERAQRATFIRSSFRDVADRDYIAARIVHKYDLWEQFYWMALQAIEKYLKAIILYHDGNTLRLGHDIVAALQTAESIKPLDMHISVRAKSFVAYLNGRGENRYFSYPLSTDGNELLHLDHTVWQIRRYCDDYFFPHDHPVLIKHSQARLAYVHEKALKDRAKFRLVKNGYLEQILDSRKHRAVRDCLVWKNLYFGARNRKYVNVRVAQHWRLPGNFIFPEILDWVKQRVRLDKSVIEAMETKLRTTIKPPVVQGQKDS